MERSFPIERKLVLANPSRAADGSHDDPARRISKRYHEINSRCDRGGSGRRPPTSGQSGACSGAAQSELYSSTGAATWFTTPSHDSRTIMKQTEDNHRFVACVGWRGRSCCPQADDTDMAGFSAACAGRRGRISRRRSLRDSAVTPEILSVSTRRSVPRCSCAADLASLRIVAWISGVRSCFLVAMVRSRLVAGSSPEASIRKEIELPAVADLNINFSSIAAPKVRKGHSRANRQTSSADPSS